MRAVIYHEVRPESLATVLQQGIKCSNQGEKTDSVVQRTDECLETRMPQQLSASGLSRRQVVYGYLAVGDQLIDIRTGEAVDTEGFASQRDLTLLRITADAADCYVSDLDAYDAVKMCVESGADDTLLARLADRYWSRVLPLEAYQAGSYRRPEVMVTHDVLAEDIEVVTGDG
jgi:hypothetical protein